MDPKSLATSAKNAPKKLRFAPKAPPKREQKLVLPKAEKTENDADGALAEQLLKKLNESNLKGRPKFERKSGPSQVAFGFGGQSSSTFRSYGSGKNRNQESSSDGGAGNVLEKEYKEPWDYYTYYPVTVPLRRPYSGNPELLDKEEFEGDQDYDEHATNSAAELGLLEDNLENKMIFLQLPAGLPMRKQPPKTEAQEMGNKNTNTPKATKASKKPVKLEELPASHLGKLLVYRSGAVKLKLGDTLYDVSAGLAGAFSQDVFVINKEEKHCCNLWELNKRAIVTPDIDSILDSVSDL